MNVLFNEFVLCLVGCVCFFYFIRKKRNVVMHSRFDVCVLIVLSELICYCEQSCFVLLNVFGIFFRKTRCCFATMFVLVSFSSFCFFLERGICYWNKSCFGLAFCVWSYCVFCLDIKVLLCDAVLSFLFCYVCFNKC